MPGVYLSYPFCAQKCTYCNFASGVFPRDWEPRYLAALQRELERQTWPWTPETIYWGGGTPSLIPPDSLRAVMAAIPGRGNWREATMEAAPGSFTSESVQAWREAGINRVSLGAQSFVQAELARTGRKHTAAIVERDVAMLRDEGITGINIDLIAGLAGQTRASWQESLEWIAKLDPPHASVYLLDVDEDSRLGKELTLGGVRYGALDVPSDELIAEFYETVVRELAALGIGRYEISNFAKAGHESLHNLKYWQGEPYLGFGADAHSFDGTERWQNAETVREYLDAPDPRQAPEPAALASERLYLGLRLTEKGVELTPGDRARHQAALDRFTSEGLLEESGGRLRLTPRGVLLSNEVFQELI
jgi:oxygen-independent coproporphyrinogen-3 oxidase